MDPQVDEGLGGSVAIYAAAMAGALAAIMLPIYFANAPAVYKNSGPKSFSEILAARAEARQYPLAKLEQPQIVDPAVVAALNAKADARRARSKENHRPVQRNRRTATPRTVQHTAQQQSYAKSPPARPLSPLALFFPIFR
jgi:hypothetical protein